MKKNYLKPEIEGKELLIQNLLTETSTENVGTGDGVEGEEGDAKLFDWDE